MRWELCELEGLQWLDGQVIVLLSVDLNYPQTVEDWPHYTGIRTFHLQKTFEDEKLEDFKNPKQPHLKWKSRLAWLFWPVWVLMLSSI